MRQRDLAHLKQRSCEPADQRMLTVHLCSSLPGALRPIKRIAARLARAFEEGRIDLIAPNAITPEAAQELARRMPD